MYNDDERRKQRIDIKELCSMIAWAAVNEMPRQSLLGVFKQKIRSLNFEDLMRLKVEVEQTPLLDLPKLLKRTTRFTRAYSLAGCQYLMNLGVPTGRYLEALCLLNQHFQRTVYQSALEDALRVHHADTTVITQAEDATREEILSLIHVESGEVVEEPSVYH